MEAINKYERLTLQGTTNVPSLTAYPITLEGYVRVEIEGRQAELSKSQTRQLIAYLKAQLSNKN